MHAFKDTAGQSWELSINVASIRRVRDSVDVDLPGLWAEKMKPLADLLQDPCKFVDVLWVLVKPQAEGRGIQDESFGSAMGGDALEEASTAFLEELVDFFPAQKAKTLRDLLREMKAAGSRMLERLDEEVKALDGKSLADKLISSFGDAPESAVLSRGHLRSAS